MPKDPPNPIDYASPSIPAPSQTAREILKWSLRIVILISVGMCIQFDFNRIFILKKPERIAEPYRLWDNWISYDAAPGKGLFLSFEHFPEADAGYVQNIYYRAVYDLYPRPLLVSDPKIKISDGLDVMKYNKSPGDQWLLDHNVNSVMSIQMDKKKNLPIITNVRWLDE